MDMALQVIGWTVIVGMAAGAIGSVWLNL